MKSQVRGLMAMVVGKELHRMLFNPLVVAAVVLLLLVTALATLISTDTYIWGVRQYEEVITPREESPTANLGATVAVRPSPLHIIARGTGDTLSRPVNAMRQLEAAFNIKYSVGQERRQQELVYSLVDDVDTSFVLRMLLPLLALLLSYSVVCGERQEGTLRQVLSNPVSRRSLLTGKIIAGAMTLLVVVAMIFLVTLLVIWSKDIQLAADEGLRLLVIAIAVYFYALTFLLIGILVSASVSNQDLSILVCLAIWCLLVIVAPGASAGIAELLSPAPPTHLVYTEKLALERSIRGGDAMEGSAENMRKVNERTLGMLNGIDSDFFNAVSRQEALARNIGLVSPALNLDAIAMAYAGSSIEEEHEMMRQLRRHFREVSRYDDLEAVLFQRTKPDELPPFEYQPLGQSALVARTVLHWGAMAVTILLLLAASYLRFNRYDVR